MSNAERCKDCKSFNQLRNVPHGTCWAVAKFLSGHHVQHPAAVHASFGCVLWEEKECEEVYRPRIRKLSEEYDIIGVQAVAHKLDEIIDYLNRS